MEFVDYLEHFPTSSSADSLTSRAVEFLMLKNQDTNHYLYNLVNEQTIGTLIANLLNQRNAYLRRLQLTESVTITDSSSLQTPSLQTPTTESEQKLPTVVYITPERTRNRLSAMYESTATLTVRCLQYEDQIKQLHHEATVLREAAERKEIVNKYNVSIKTVHINLLRSILILKCLI